jgi:chorismate mutase
MDKLEITPFLRDKGKRTLYIAGPCSAESREQLLETAQALKPAGIEYFRAGVWKPRTRPGGFEGKGAEAIQWLAEVRKLTGLKVITEVANPVHLEMVLNEGIDAIWIGARTTVNPFVIQEIADALKGVDIPVFVKNPINPDLKLWIGALERINRAGISRLAAIHRGFSVYGESDYRNPPRWQMAIDLKRHFPDLPLFCDSSHISGNRERLSAISQQALDLGYDGIHLEVHPNPDQALSDAEQQITPQRFKEIIAALNFRRSSTDDLIYLENLQNLRNQIDEVDDELIRILAQRMELTRRIGHFKKENNISIYQPKRWNEILTRSLKLGKLQSLGASFIESIFKIIHQESIREQSEIIHEDEKKSTQSH